jgi:LemA protein
MITGVLLVVLVLVLLIGISGYNRLVTLRNQVAAQWRQIDVQLRRRHDLIPNLVETVKGAMAFEQGTLEAVVAARSRATTATAVPDVIHAEGELSQALGRLLAVTEAYPDLKSLGNVSQLQEQLAQTENAIAGARGVYNEVATRYNIAQATIPTNLVAGLARATPAELWQIDDDTERAVPTVRL